MDGAQVRLVSARGGEGYLFCRQQLQRHLQPLQAAVGALAPVAAPMLGSPVQQNQSPRMDCIHPMLVHRARWVQSGDPHVCVGKAAGTAQGTGGDGGRWAVADVYVGQREPAGARLWLGPGFRACSFSRLTGGQWAGSRAGGGPRGLSGPL